MDCPPKEWPLVELGSTSLSHWIVVDSAIPTFEPRSLMLIEKVPLLLRFKLRTMEQISQFEAGISFRVHCARNI